MGIIKPGNALCFLVFVCFAGFSFAQEGERGDDEKLKRFEMGGHFTMMFQDDYEPKDVAFRRFGFDEAAFTDRRYESGFGGRLTYNINRNLAVEGEVNFTPSVPTLNERAANGQPTNRAFPGGEKTQILGGVKYGVRNRKWGVFGKVRPGAIRFNAFPKIVARFVVASPTGGQPLDVLIFSQEFPATFLNVDVGGVFEYYPSKRTIVRFDVGDTIIRYNAQEPKDINPSFTRHNLQMNVGFGFRF